MKIYLDCVPCFFKQTIKVCRMLGFSEDKTKSVLDKVAIKLTKVSMNASPPEVGGTIHRIIREQTHNPDPYKTIKEKSNALALAAYPTLKKLVRNAGNRLLKAVEIAIAGNIIDYGALMDLDIHKEIDLILKAEEDKVQAEETRYFAFMNFCASLENAKTLLYLADNTGEIVFDRVLMEEIKLIYPDIKIYCAVRGFPVINDCTVEDAVAAGVDKIATVIGNGADAPGTILRACSGEFLEIWHNSDLIVSKGQGNFESLSGTQDNDNIFFLFIAKCQVLADELGCTLRDIILCRS